MMTMVTIFSRADSLLGKDLETNKVTNVACAALPMQQANNGVMHPVFSHSSVNTFPRQRIEHKNRVTTGNDIFYSVRAM